jgi:hypothetical protein
MVHRKDAYQEYRFRPDDSRSVLVIGSTVQNTNEEHDESEEGKTDVVDAAASVKGY